MPRRLSGLLAHPRSLLAALVLGTLVSTPALATGWFNDDFVMRLLLDTGIEGYPLGPTQLYEFTPPQVPARVAMQHGYLAWFTDPEFSMRFFRPLSSLLIAVDEPLFGRSALLAHVHQLLWFLALVFTVGRVHRRVLRPSAAGLATVLYAVSSAHAMSVAWVAARHVLVGGTFAALALLMHIGWRQTGQRHRAVVSVIALGLGLLASEAALGAVAFIVLYEVLARPEARAERLRSAVPALALALAHLAFYVLGGWGVHHSRTYLSPFSDPVAYTRAAMVRVPVLLGEGFGGVPSELSGMGPLEPALVAYGLVTTAVVVLLVRSGRVVRRDRWLLASTVLALAPVVGGFIGGRLLVVAGLGASGLVATAVVRACVRIEAQGGVLTRLGLTLLVVLNLVVAPLMRVALGGAMMQLSKDQEHHARGLDLQACADTTLLLSLTGSDPSNSMFLGPSLLFYTPERVERFESVRALSMATAPQRFTRDGERSFVLEILGERVVNPIEALHYAAPPVVGSTREIGALTVHTTAGDELGWTAARFEVDRPLEDVCFGSWDGEALVLWRAPMIGESRELVYAPGMMGM